MESLLIFVTTLAVVSSMFIPNTTYVIPAEILEKIFGPPNQTKPTGVDTLAVAPNESAFITKHTRPYQKKTSVIHEIKIDDGDKNGSLFNTATGNWNPELGVPEVHTRFVENLSLTDDRVALQGDCPSGKVRIGDLCETPDER